MAASIDVGWTAPAQLSPSNHISRKRRWDDDHHLMLHLMLGQLDGGAQTLDLLGASGCPQPFESLELDLDAPLPSGWEKCLDLKTGSIYYINRSNGTSTFWHPKKRTVADLNSPPSPSSSSGLTREVSTVETSHQPNVKMHKGFDDFWAGTLRTPATAGDGRLQLGLSLSVDLNSLPEDQLHETCRTPAIEYAPLAEQAWIQKSGAVCMTASSCSSSSSPSTISFHELDGSGELRDRRPGKVSEIESITSEAPSMMTVGCAKCLMFVMLSRTDPKCPKCGTCAPLDFLKPVAKKSKFGFAT